MAPSPEGCPPRPRPPSTPRFGRPGPQRASSLLHPPKPPRRGAPRSRKPRRRWRGGELVGERDPIGGADEVQLHPVDAEGTPPHPRRPGESRALRDLSRGCKTESKVESTTNVCGLPIIS